MPAQTTQDTLHAFFKAYEERTNRALEIPPRLDVDEACAAFADAFVGANPKGVHAGRNDESLREAIPKGFEFYRRLGTTAMNIGNVAFTPLNPQHWMARVHWKAHYLFEDGHTGAIEFSVVYLVQLLNEEPKIFAYVAGDEEQAYREHGIVPWRENV